MMMNKFGLVAAFWVLAIFCFWIPVSECAEKDGAAMTENELREKVKENTLKGNVQTGSVLMENVLKENVLTDIVKSSPQNSGNTLKCHVCNSLHNDACDILEDDRYLVECMKINDNPGKNHTICRKEVISVTSVEFNLQSSRTIRTCGYQKHPKFSCFFNSNHDLKETICECEEDGCNEGSTSRFSLQFLIYSLLSTYVMLKLTS